MSTSCKQFPGAPDVSAGGREASSGAWTKAEGRARKKRPGSTLLLTSAPQSDGFAGPAAPSPSASVAPSAERSEPGPRPMAVGRMGRPPASELEAEEAGRWETTHRNVRRASEFSAQKDIHQIRGGVIKVHDPDGVAQLGMRRCGRSIASLTW